ncbi:MAG TPA: hypothetical protein VM686_14285, partial [Polyangiaceae bacterium]|nr:hypothetical protein [Polyangiaceae bacterium]
KELADELANGGVADPARTLGDTSRQDLVERIAKLRERGLRALVVVAEPGRPLDEVRPLWGMLGLNEQKDLLLLHNGTRWEAKGWGLGREQIAAALDASEPALRDAPVQGFVEALDRLSLLVLGPEPESTFPWLPLSAGAVAVAGLSWVIARRRKLARERRVRIASALASAEAVQADVVLAAEALPGDTAAEIQLKAATLAEELRRAAESENERLAVGRLTQLESELNALHSDVMARTRRGQGE